MTFSLADVDAALGALRVHAGADVGSLPRGELMRLMRLVGQVKAAADRLAAAVAGEVARRSTVDDGPAGMARQHGFASPEQLVASVTGTAHGEGARLVRAGGVMSKAGPLGDCLRGGALSVAMVDLIAQTIAPLPGDTTALEARLTRAARRLDYRALKLTCAREAARFDAAHKESLERRQHEQRSLDITEDASGMIHVRGSLPPVQGAILLTFLDAQTKHAFQAKRDGTDDERTATQIRADALIALATHGLDCTSPATGVKATIILRVDAATASADSANADTGLATCDALTTPISLTSLRQLAMDATILPMLVNHKNEVLDMWREERLFSWAQRMALAERDGGCAKCHAPISHCITHHIRWWSCGGPTNLTNGVLLCVRCHTQVHRDGWGIHVDDDNHVWFTPPAAADPHRTRILGGLAALTTT